MTVTIEMDPILEPLILPDGVTADENDTQQSSTERPCCGCLLCDLVFPAEHTDDQILGHLLLHHRLVIADAKNIVDLRRYVSYWKGRFKEEDPRQFCFLLKAPNEGGVEEEFLMLDPELPEDGNLRDKLQKERLILVLKQQHKERSDETFSHSCLFCRKTFTGNRKELFDHMNFDHNFSVGLPDNLVFIREFLAVLNEKLSHHLCLYCERTFKDRTVLKEHMRKKQHKKINPNNRQYDKFYVVNYLEPGKNWQDIMNEFDEQVKEEDWSDWLEPPAQAICLFCDFSSSDLPTLSTHITDHGFDFASFQQHFGFYQQIKIVNYIRRQLHENKCIFCNLSYPGADKLKEHMESEQHLKLPDMSEWDQAQFYFPTYENDTLLCLLEADGASDQGQDQVAIIAEEVSSQLTLNDAMALKKELENQ